MVSMHKSLNFLSEGALPLRSNNKNERSLELISADNAAAI